MMGPATFCTIIFTFLITFVISFPLKRLAFKFDIVDAPDARKVHKKPIPLLGGLAIYCGFIFFCCLNPYFFSDFGLIIAAVTIVFLLNLVDDMCDLSAKLRLGIELLAAFMVIYSGARIDFLPAGFWGSTVEVIFTIIWILGITNGFNYLDGLDGLATGSAIINLLFFALILMITGQDKLAYFSCCLAAACLGFLPHNFRKATMFLGDSGSTFLGFLLAVIPLAGSWAQDSIVKVSIPILILGVPIFDMFFTTIMRIRDGKVKTFNQWLKYAGKDHFHHVLVYVGLSPFKAVLFIWATTFSLGLSALLVANTVAWKGIVTLFQASIIFLMIGVLIVVGRKHESGWTKE